MILFAMSGHWWREISCDGNTFKFRAATDEEIVQLADVLSKLDFELEPGTLREVEFMANQARLIFTRRASLVVKLS